MDCSLGYMLEPQGPIQDQLKQNCWRWGSGSEHFSKAPRSCATSLWNGWFLSSFYAKNHLFSAHKALQNLVPAFLSLASSALPSFFSTLISPHQQHLWVHAQSLSPIWFLLTPWAVAYQASLFMGFSQQEYWSGLPCPSPYLFPTQRLNMSFLHLLHWQVDS